jgi:hypothetical protein
MPELYTAEYSPLLPLCNSTLLVASVYSCQNIMPMSYTPSNHLDPLEIDILNQREAFHLPPQPVCDTLVDIFFKWIAPVLPVVNRHDFMRKYHNAENPPSILLLQAIFMTASRFYVPQAVDPSTVAPRVFYKKAKALYDAGYELNETPVLQAVVLMGIYWDGPDGKPRRRCVNGADEAKTSQKVDCSTGAG